MNRSQSLLMEKRRGAPVSCIAMNRCSIDIITSIINRTMPGFDIFVEGAQKGQGAKGASVSSLWHTNIKVRSVNTQVAITQRLFDVFFVFLGGPLSTSVLPFLFYVDNCYRYPVQLTSTTATRGLDGTVVDAAFRIAARFGRSSPDVWIRINFRKKDTTTS